MHERRIPSSSEPKIASVRRCGGPWAVPRPRKKQKAAISVTFVDFVVHDLAQRRRGIHHALRFTVDCTRRSYVWPARHQAGVANPACPPMGARFRLKAGYDMRGHSPRAQIVLRAMKRYGMIVADNGSDWYFQGAVDPRWTYSFVDQLKRVPARAFVAVDASACRVTANSGAFAYGPGCPRP
jgi:hypothetical protein